MQRLGKSALLFVTIGLAIYALVYYAAEQLMYRTGKSNPFYKIATAERTEFDWIILGASHAMPLDFADFNAFMERETGRRILNLASPGTGPLYNRFVLEHFLSQRRTANLLYVVDSFAFYSPAWNEERFADAKLIRRTPWESSVARRLFDYSRHAGVDPRAVLDYASGFSKINNRERFEPDIWEGEKQFDRVYRPSAAAVRSRIAYLYPGPRDDATFSKYLNEFDTLLATARQHGVRVTAIKTPVPADLRRRLPEEQTFDEAISRVLGNRQVPLHDFSAAMDEPKFYFDTDHLNRTGLTEFLQRHLKTVLTGTDNRRP
ncbi:MAG: hypothetical protein IT539_00300 [Bradyrhizobiaceae bacterium]|nr:hypothetical protein [Bradyrhizobiaceae bacterium]